MSDLLPPQPPTGRIAFAQIEALTLSGTMRPQQALEAALVGGTRIERYGRVWRMGPWKHEGQAIVGRIGFESAGINELWDEDAQDFREGTRQLGLTSPFAVDPATLRVAFQVRGSDIRVKSFTGALEDLLNQASPADRWRVEREFTEISFEEWATTKVARVALIRATLERPNPHYAGRERIEEIVKGTRARLAELVVRADPADPQGIDVNSPIVREAVDHVSRNYGSLTAVGELHGDETQWTSKGNGAAEVRRAGADPMGIIEDSDLESRGLRDPVDD